MIVIDDPKGPSHNPPTFEESADHIVLDFSPQQNVPDVNDSSPPEFTPYKADFFKLKNGWIISHDPHLNQDGPSPLFSCFIAAADS
jgi:hypothetical protein